jgi:hypothetical protein
LQRRDELHPQHFWDTTTVIPTVAAIIWQDALTGNVVPAPTGSLTPGRCQEPLKNGIYLTENTGILTVDDIQTAVGGGRVHSVYCYQLVGDGAVIANGFITLHTGQVWQIEALEYPIPLDLHGTGLTFKTSGVQQITAYYLQP